MPLFEYVCENCGTRFEKLLRQQQTEHPCPACGQTATKAISAPAPTAGGCSSPAGSGFG